MRRFKRFISIVVLILMIIGLGYGIKISFQKNMKKEDASLVNVFSKVQVKEAEVTEFFTYGTSLNFSCKIPGIKKDNYESARLIITDGLDYEKSYKVSSSFVDNSLTISTTNQINNNINLDKLNNGSYYLLIKLRLNNSSTEKYYLLKTQDTFNAFKYYTVTNNKENSVITVENKKFDYESNNYLYLVLNKQKENLPADVYDIVIDAGHGGDDVGNKSDGVTEADITLDYANTLKDKLEAKGYKVKLTRTTENSSSYKEKETYSASGRITSACASKAKFMLSLHVNNGNSEFTGVELYAPSKTNLDFAKSMVENITNSTSLGYSNVGKYKVLDGVYVKNFGANEIATYQKNAEKNGYDNYNLNTDTPLLFTIREVGGVATNAFIDGRNKNYDANAYYKSIQGIECYQLELGYIKKDLEIIQNEKEQYVNSIVDSIVTKLNY